MPCAGPAGPHLARADPGRMPEIHRPGPDQAQTAVPDAGPRGHSGTEGDVLRSVENGRALPACYWAHNHWRIIGQWPSPVVTHSGTVFAARRRMKRIG